MLDFGTARLLNELGQQGSLIDTEQKLLMQGCLL